MLGVFYASASIMVPSFMPEDALHSNLVEMLRALSSGLNVIYMTSQS